MLQSLTSLIINFKVLKKLILHDLLFYNYFFVGCSVIIQIKFLGAVTRIGLMAFQGCTSLTSITIPASVTDLGESTFRGIFKFLI